MTLTALDKTPVDEPEQSSGTAWQLPPSPPETLQDSLSTTDDSVTGVDVDESALTHKHRSYPLPPRSRPTQSVLPEDLRTPDAHVPRDPRLIRLTGAHPFNVEPPLTDLWAEGFLTSKDLFFVRNHGAVPRVPPLPSSLPRPISPSPSPASFSPSASPSHYYRPDEAVLDWRLTVEGLVANPLSLTLRELLDGFEQVTYPVTLVCAGNRRKEQNVVRKTRGFSWGAAGVSTALWTGVPLDALLERARPLVRSSRRGGGGGGGRGPWARYVCFEGADQLPNGPYGTGIRLAWAADPGRGVLVAHGMNGEPLPPDHGRPLRVVVPGQIGGRSVKWLRRIVVTEAPSDSWYHIYDNRVLPTGVSPEASADLPGTWRDERYAIYELNVNSAIVRPAHDERVRVTGEGGGEEDRDVGGARDGGVVSSGGGGGGGETTYKFQGYAYAGGGRRVTRVEVTLDRGRSWRLADVTYPEDQYRRAPEGEMLFGGRLDVGWRETCFCWCLWSLAVPVRDLLDRAGACPGGDVMVRAMDEAMAAQPRDMYWSVLGMMNNPWYRVLVHREGEGEGEGGQGEGGLALRFEHPTQPALRPGGWMERVKAEGGDLTNGYWGERVGGGEAEDEKAAPKPVKEIIMTGADVKRVIGIKDVREHDLEAEPWFVLKGEVYDGTGFLKGHPGGAASIVSAAGQDVTDEFMAIHSDNAKAMMPAYHIGTLDAASRKLLESRDGPLSDPNSDTTTTGSSASEPRPVFLDPKQWRQAALTAKTAVSGDTKVLTFALDHPGQRLGLPAGQHLLVRLRDPATREAVVRAYTPVSDPDPDPDLTLAAAAPAAAAAAAPGGGRLDLLVKIYPGGTMSRALDAIPLGHRAEFRGPVGRFRYLGRGRCAVSGGGREGEEERRVARLVLVCAGSGVTPILAVLKAVLRDEGEGEDGGGKTTTTTTTYCTVLDGNRGEDDILCRRELDGLAAGAGAGRCRVVHTLSRPGAGWTGRRGRMDRALLEREVGPPRSRAGARDEMVLVCGPGPMERSVRESFLDMGWREDDLFFF